MTDLIQGHINHNDFIRHEGIKRLSKLLNSLVADKIIVAYRLEIDFKLDHKTLDKLKQEDLTVAQYTLDKMRSAIAYYLGEYRAKVNRINDEEIKREKLEKISEYEESYKSGGDENRALYITVVTDGDLIKGVYMLYGEQYKALAGDGTEVENGRTAISKIFDCLDCKFEAVAVIPKEYYGTLHMQNRLELEALIAQQTALFEKEVEIDGVPCLIIYSQR